MDKLLSTTTDPGSSHVVSTGCSAVSVTRPVPWQMVGWLAPDYRTGGIFLSVSEG